MNYNSNKKGSYRVNRFKPFLDYDESNEKSKVMLTKDYVKINKKSLSKRKVKKVMEKDKRQFTKRKERDKIIIELSSSDSEISSISRKSNNSNSYEISDMSRKDRDYCD